MKRLMLFVALFVTVGALAACRPIVPSGALSEEAALTLNLDEGAVATVTATSLRVRAAPSETAEVVAGVREGEQYRVIGRSSDGQWVQLAVARAQSGTGWVSANFVTVEGDITDTVVTEVPAAEATAVQEEAATEAAGEEAGAELVELTAPEPGFAVVNTEGVRLRVRAVPSTDAEIVGYVYRGETFPVEEVSADGTWVKIGGDAATENPDGGWVAAEFVIIGE
ncbi:MAG: SH3 domain-containing protein [Caldilineaceae bacterium]|nr:SH3 domain-containing protein [Caldilineaceae bacterium]